MRDGAVSHGWTYKSNVDIHLSKLTKVPHITAHWCDDCVFWSISTSFKSHFVKSVPFQITCLCLLLLLRQSRCSSTAAIADRLDADIYNVTDAQKQHFRERG